MFLIDEKKWRDVKNKIKYLSKNQEKEIKKKWEEKNQRKKKVKKVS